MVLLSQFFLPLWQKPILVISSKDEDSSVSLPKPAVDAAEVRKVSDARAQLFRRTSQGDAFPAKMAPLDHRKNLTSYKYNCMTRFDIILIIIKEPSSPFRVNFKNTEWLKASPKNIISKDDTGFHFWK